MTRAGNSFYSTCETDKWHTTSWYPSLLFTFTFHLLLYIYIGVFVPYSREYCCSELEHFEQRMACRATYGGAVVKQDRAF